MGDAPVALKLQPSGFAHFCFCRARVDISALPGGSGVMISYEVLSPIDGIVHHEHAILARTTTGITCEPERGLVATDHSRTVGRFREGKNRMRACPHGRIGQAKQNVSVRRIKLGRRDLLLLERLNEHHGQNWR